MTLPSPEIENALRINRRHFFGRQAKGLGTAALASLLDRQGLLAQQAQPPAGPGMGLDGLPHHPAKASASRLAVGYLYLCQNGAPTHVDLFDYKPEIVAQHGKPVPEDYFKGKRFSTMTGDPTGKVMLQPVEPFKQRGQSGAWVSNFLPYTAAIADDLCFVKSMHTDAVNHAPAISFFVSGAQIPGRPTLGAWMTYGLGVESDNLPGFVVMTSVSKGTTCGQIFYDFYWGSGFLPSRFQGVQFRGGGTPVLYLDDPAGMTRGLKRGLLDDIAQVNRLKWQQSGDPEIETRIAQYEMAYRMQTGVPELTDFSNEPKHVLDMYGPQVREQGTFAYNCLMARRLIERGTRYVQVMHAGWDQHNSVTTELYTQCKDTDQPSAALVQDLKQRGLLDDTLVLWGGEFGRTPFLQGDINNRPKWGRDHHPYAFTVWMAGGGIQPGISYGASDELAMNAVEKPVHIHDLQATILHQLGIDHERLTYKFQGRYYRLTDVHGQVVRDILS